MKRRILAVDDDPMNREIIGEILGEDYDVAFACNGLEALDKAAEFRPELVVLDIMMPALDGYATCERLKARDPFIKVLLVSAKALPSERLRGYSVGADDYVTKPFDPYEFLAKIRVFLRLSFAEEVGQLKSDLITLLAHETRTPLTHILSAAQLLEDHRTFASAPERDVLLEIILSSTQRLLTIFEKSMLLFQQQSEGGPLKGTPLELSSVMRSEIDRISNRVSGATIEIAGVDDLIVLADEHLLRHALGILLDQAARRSPPGTPVTVRLELSEGCALVSIVDAGPSLDDGALDRFFVLFSVKEISHHSGAVDLDRPICACIIRRHGGSVHVTVPAAGGLCCHISLPIHVSAEKAA